MSGFSEEVAMAVTQPLWPDKEPRNLSCSAMLLKKYNGMYNEVFRNRIQVWLKPKAWDTAIQPSRSGLPTLVVDAAQTAIAYGTPYDIYNKASVLIEHRRDVAG